MSVSTFPAAAKVSAALTVASVEPLGDAVSPIGYVASLSPQGYVLLRADDLCPPIKFYSDRGSFAALPPGILAVLRYELDAELASLKAAAAKGASIDATFQAQWAALKNGNASSAAVNDFRADAETLAGPLLSTTWNQNDPYNYYAPTAAGGPGGRAYAGCVACAMAQIMRYHQSPTVLNGTHTYSDNDGSCQGSHSTSDAGIGAYDWANMPLSISSGSSTAQKQAVGQLTYHAGVTVDMDFEATGSGAVSDYVPEALRNHFGYSCGNLLYKDGTYTDTQWYNMINADIVASRPVFYAMRNPANEGHAVVCDGTRNGNELHINMGWSGTQDAWYTIPNIAGFTLNHRCITGIVTSTGGGGGGGGTGSTGIFTVAQLKAKVYWTNKKVPAGLLPVGVGDIVIKGSTPTTLTSLAPLSGANLGNTIVLNVGGLNFYYTNNFFATMDKKCQKAVFGAFVPDYKWKWVFTVQIKKGLLVVTGVGKYMWNQDSAFGVSNSACDWTTKPVSVELNITGGGIEVHAKGTKTIAYKTKENSATTVK